MEIPLADELKRLDFSVAYSKSPLISAVLTM